MHVVAVCCCSVLLQCVVAVCCSLKNWSTLLFSHVVHNASCCSMLLQCIVAVCCCSVLLQCVTLLLCSEYYKLLHYVVAVCYCSVWLQEVVAVCCCSVLLQHKLFRVTLLLCSTYVSCCGMLLQCVVAVSV